MSWVEICKSRLQVNDDIMFKDKGDNISSKWKTTEWLFKSGKSINFQNKSINKLKNSVD